MTNNKTKIKIVKDMLYYEKLKKYILQHPEGTAFAFSDFCLFGENEEIRKALTKLIDKNICKEFLPDIYYRPLYSQLLNKEVGPVSDSVAYAVARKHGWKISPSLIHAENKLGLSTQVPACSIFLSTGPSCKYTFKGIPVEFIHSKEEYFQNMSCVPAMVVTALQAIEDEKSMAKTIRMISSRLTAEHKEKLQAELQYAPAHLQPHLIQISNL